MHSRAGERLCDAVSLAEPAPLASLRSRILMVAHDRPSYTSAPNVVTATICQPFTFQGPPCQGSLWR